jgi:hypothetical protein
MSVTAQTQGQLTLTDSAASTTQLSKILTGTFTGTESSVGQSVLIGTSSFPIALPTNPIHKLYIKNLSGVATVTVTWTPTGGSTATILTLQPSDYIDLVSSGASGISLLSVVASAVSTPIEFWLLG